MNRIIVFISILISFSSFKLHSKDLPVITELPLWDSIIYASYQHDKLIFVQVYSEYCGTCSEFDKDVIKDTLVNNMLNDYYILAKVKLESEAGAALVERYSLENVPVSLILNYNTSLVYRINGYRPVNDFFPIIAEYAAKYEDFKILLLKYLSQLTTQNDLLKLLNNMYDLKFGPLAHKMAEEYISKYQLNYSLNELDLYSTYFRDYKSEELDSLLDNYKTYSILLGNSEVNECLRLIFNYNFQIASDSAEAERFDFCMKILDLVVFTDQDFPKERSKMYYAMMYYEQTNQWTKYFEVAKNYKEKFDPEPSELRNLIVNIYLNSIVYGEVEEVDKWAAELAKDKSFENLVTYAFTQQRLGETATVKKLLKRAKKLIESEDQENVFLQVEKELLTK